MTLLCLLAIGTPWLLQAYDAWRDRRTVRRECAMLDLELDFL